jgi:hypothetical protein
MRFLVDEEVVVLKNSSLFTLYSLLLTLYGFKGEEKIEREKVTGYGINSSNASYSTNSGNTIRNIEIYR